MLISHRGHTDTIQVYSVTVMTHVKALQAGHSSQGTPEPITPALKPDSCHLITLDPKVVISDTVMIIFVPQVVILWFDLLNVLRPPFCTLALG